MNDTEHLVRRYIAVWNERNAARRRASIETTFRPDVHYTDPLVDLHGLEDSMRRSARFKPNPPISSSVSAARSTSITIPRVSPGVWARPTAARRRSSASTWRNRRSEARGS